MTFVEFIGFIVALAILMFSAVRRVLEERRRTADPEKYKREVRKQREQSEKAYRDLLKSLNIEVPEEMKPPPPPVPKKESQKGAAHKVPTPAKAACEAPHRRLSEDFELHTNIEDRKRINPIETREFDTRIGDRFGENYGRSLVNPELRGSGPARSKTRGRVPRIQNVLAGLPSNRSLIYAKEIIGPPKALQSGWSDIPGEESA